MIKLRQIKATIIIIILLIIIISCFHCLTSCDGGEIKVSDHLVVSKVNIEKLIDELYRGELIDDSVHCSSAMLGNQKKLELGLLRELDWNKTNIIPKINLVNSQNNSFLIRIDTAEIIIELNNKNQLDFDKEKIIQILALGNEYTDRLFHERKSKYELEPILLELFTRKQNSSKYMRYLGRYYEDILQADSSLKYYNIGSELGDDRSSYKYRLIHQEEFGVDSTIKKLWEMYNFENRDEAIGAIASIYYDAWVHGGIFGSKYPSDWSERKMISILKQAGKTGDCYSFTCIILYYDNLNIDSTRYYLKKKKLYNCELSEDEISLLLDN